MADFATTLAAYLKHAASFDDVNNALTDTLKNQPSQAPELRRELEQLRDSRKLQMQDFAKLEVVLMQYGETRQTTETAPQTAQWREAAYWQEGWQHRAASEPRSGVLLDNRYRLEQVRQTSSHTESWEAVDTRAGKSEKRVTVHLLPASWSHCPQAVRSFLQRLEQYSQLSHEQLVKVHAAGHSNGQLYAVTELLPDMSSLVDLLGKYPTGLPAREVHSILDALSDVFDYVLQQGLPELYLAPADIYYDPVKKTAKILDFGLPVLNDGMLLECAEAALFLPGNAYRSCESLSGYGGDLRDATYALACLAYELLSGQHPFGHKSALEARDRQYLVTPIKTLGKHQSQVLLKALSFTRLERPNPRDFSHALFPQRNKLLLPAAVLGGLFLMVVLVWAFYHTLLKPQRVKAGILEGKTEAIQTLESWGPKQQENFLADGALRLAVARYYAQQHKSEVFDGIHKLTPEAHTVLLNDPGVAEMLFDYFQQAVDDALREDKFALADDFQAKLASAYPTDAERLAALIAQHRNARETELATAYQSCLQLTDIPLQAKTPCLLASRPPLVKLNPQHPLLDDALPELYAVAARELLDSRAYQAATTLIADWAQVLPDASPERQSLQDILTRSQNLDAYLDSEQFVPAEQLLQESVSLYPQEAHFKPYADTLQQAKAQSLKALIAKYQGYLQKGSLLPSPSGEDLFRVRAQIKYIDPEHALLHDADLHKAFFDKVIETAGRDGNTLERVSALFSTWDTLFEDSKYFTAADQETRERAINRVALHYLLKAESLPASDAAEYLSYAVKLKPVQSVQDKIQAALAGLSDANAAPSAEVPAPATTEETPPATNKD